MHSSRIFVAKLLLGGIKLTWEGYTTEAGRPVRQPYAGVNYIPHSGTINLAIGSRPWRRVVEPSLEAT